MNDRRFLPVAVSSQIHTVLACLLIAACSETPAGMSQDATSVGGFGGGATVPVAGVLAAGSGIGSLPATAGRAGIVAGMGAAVPNAFAGTGGRAVAGASAGVLGMAGASGVAGMGRAGAGAAGAAGAGAVTAGRSGAGGGPAASGGSGGSAGAPAGGYNPCPAAPEPCKILPFGDSITYGLGFAGGYRVELFSKAVAAGKHITFTGSQMNGPEMVSNVAFPKNNEGHSGWKINQLLPLVPMPALQPLPHIILLMIGTNDVAQNDSLSAAPMRLGALLDKVIAAAPDALIVVANLTPLGSGSGAIQTYNAAIPAVVDARIAAGKHLLRVDQFTGFTTSMLGDGVHPNQMGYARMAGVWYDAIGGLLH